MNTEHRSESRFSPARWFLGADGLVRPAWRAFLFVLLGLFLLRLIHGALLRFTAGAPIGAGFALERAAFCAGLLLESWFLLSVFDRRSFRSLGLCFYRECAREFLMGTALGLGLISVVVGLLVATGTVRYQAVLFGGDVAAGLARNAMALLVAATFEELAFRGYGFQRLIEAAGRLGAILIFSALFAAAHLGNASATALSAANTVLAGVLLAVAYLRTRALWMPIGLHWAWNFFLGPVYSLPVSGLYFAQPVFRVEITGPAWLSGGAYGPEGSVLLTLACGAAVVWLWRAKWVCTSPAMQEVLQ